MSDLSSKNLARGMFWLCRLVLGGLFLCAAIRKMSAPQEFADSIASYHLVPHFAIGLIALGLPLFELACGVLLLTGYFCTTGLLSVIGMLVVFFGALLAALIRGLPVYCGCFGGHTWLDSNPWISLARDGLLLLGAVYAYRHGVAREVGGTEQQAESVPGLADDHKIHPLRPTFALSKKVDSIRLV